MTPSDMANHPGVSGFTFESEGYHLIGTFFQARGAGAKPTALILHGLPGIEKNVDVALALRAQGWNSLIFHYRGCWGSAGSYDLRTIPVDVVHALNALTSGRYPTVDPRRVALIGHSMGGWAALVVAAQLAAEGRPPQAVVALAAVADPAQMPITEGRAAEQFTPWLTDVTPAQLVAQWQELPRPVALVSQISPTPLLIIHGTADAAVPLEHSEVLASHAVQPAEFVRFEGADHGFSWERPRLIRRVVDWLEEQIKP